MPFRLLTDLQVIEDAPRTWPWDADAGEQKRSDRISDIDDDYSLT
jgi:hypothetical protein